MNLEYEEYWRRKGGMESINDNIVPQAPFGQQLVDETGEIIGLQNRAHEIEPICESDETGISFVERTDVQDGASPASSFNSTLQTLIATRDDSRIHDDEESGSVVMVIDGMDHGNQSIQTTYQIVPQHLQLQSGRSLPLSLLPLHQTRHERLAEDSPGDFVGSDISLDSLTVSTDSQIVGVKQEQKLLILRTDDASVGSGLDNRTGSGNGNKNERNVRRRSSPHINLSMSSIHVNSIDELSSDGGVEEVTLNQHHQQLLGVHNHHHQQQYSHRASHLINQQQQHQRQQQQRGIQLGINHHRDELSVTVQADEEDMDEEEEDDEQEHAHDRNRTRDHHDIGDHGAHMLSPTLERSTYQTLTSVNNRISPTGFSPTSYATLTPIQPLPPISTMSDKFAYAGDHITGSVNASVNGEGVTPTGRIMGCGNGSNPVDGSSNDCGSFNSLPSIPHPGSLSSLSLSGLGSEVQSPYSSYDKLPSMISTPPHNYASSPSHGLSGMVGSCELHAHSPSVPSPIPGQVSPHSHSPSLHVNMNINVHKSDAVEQGNAHSLAHKHEHDQAHGHIHKHTLEQGQGHLHSHIHVHGHGHNQDSQAEQQNKVKQVISLSLSRAVADGVVVSDYESPYGRHQHDHELIMSQSSSTNSSGGRSSQLCMQHSPTLSPHSAVSAGSVISMSLHSPPSIVTLPNINGSVANITVDLPVVVSLTPTPPPGNNGSITVGVGDIVRNEQEQQQSLLQADVKDELTRNSHNVCNTTQQHHLHNHANGFLGEQQQTQTKLATHSAKSVPGTTSATSTGSSNRSSSNDMEEINTKELAQRISAELKRYSIPQAIFAQRVLCRSQGTLSDLLRNPKPWSKLKSGRETFRRMFKWLQEPEFQRMSALRMAAAQLPQRPAGPVSSGVSGAVTGTSSTASGGVSGLSIRTTSASPASDIVLVDSMADDSHGSSLVQNGNKIPSFKIHSSVDNWFSLCADMMSTSTSGLPRNDGVLASGSCRRKDEPHIEQMPQPKKPRLVFTDLQRRTLQAIFKVSDTSHNGIQRTKCFLPY